MAIVGAGRYRYQLVEQLGEAARRPDVRQCQRGRHGFARPRLRVPAQGSARCWSSIATGGYLGGWGIGAFANPHGIYIGNDVVYLTDRDDSVCLTYTLDGKPLQILGKRGAHSDTGCERPGELVPRSAGPFNYPTEMVPAPSGDLYVTDGYRNARVHRFSPAGELISSWGEPGKTEPNQFHLPHSLIADPDGAIYVCDRENNRIQVFSADGDFRDDVDGPAPAPGHLHGPRRPLLHQRGRGERAVAADQPDGQARRRRRAMGFAVGARQLDRCPWRHLSGARRARAASTSTCASSATEPGAAEA